ncbi:MAG TPA: MarR family transcriptional regulator [Acidimicrobiia bacterium]
MNASRPKDTIGRLMRAARRASQDGLALHEAIAQSLGLHVTDLRCLEVLQRGPHTAGELADEVGLTSGAMTRLLDRLESAGFVRRRPDPDDRRRVVIEPVPERMASVDEMYRGMAEDWEEILAGRSAAELAALEDLFETVHEMTLRRIEELRRGGR